MSTTCTDVPPRPDAFAALLGIQVTGQGGGRAESTLTVAPQHLNPHGTAHGALLFSLAGVALAAAANDGEHSGVVSAVHIDYLHPARLGERLVARVVLIERLEREDLFAVRIVRVAQPGDTGAEPAAAEPAAGEPGSAEQVIARLTGRATRRRRSPSS